MGISSAEVIAALRGVDDPEYPGVSVVDMGMIGAIALEDGRVTVELITTFSGCPARDVIRSDIAAALGALDGISDVSVVSSSLGWDPSRLSDRARVTMAERFTVAVAIAAEPPRCPRCDAPSLVEQSAFGPARCRAVHRCDTCNEIIEVLRA